MRDKTLSIYTAALIITLVGAGATMLIVETAYSYEEIGYADVDPLTFAIPE